MNTQNTTNLHNDTLSDLLCDAIDIRNALRFSKGNVLNKSKDNDDSDTTIGDCLNNIIETLEELYN